MQCIQVELTSLSISPDGFLLAHLLELWERSVLATHHFLPKGEVQRLRPYAQAAIMQVHLWWQEKV